MPQRQNRGPRQERRNPLALSLDLERHYGDNHEAQLGALRVVLGLPAKAVVLEGAKP